MTTKILLVEDDFALRSAISASLEIDGYKVTTAENAEMAVKLLSPNNLPDMVITDIQMKQMSGIDLLKHIRKNNLSLPVILMTAYGDVSDAVKAMQIGACDYLQKPFEAEKLSSLIENYLPNVRDEHIVIEDPASIEIFQYAKKISATQSNVLLLGESGSGKEVMAKYIHRNSNRKNEKFVAINCAAIPENMLEATLFGYEKGAFTGAHQSSAGKFEQAQAGTLLLDEISEMPLNLQAKILRVIQEKEVERLAGKKMIKLDVRIIATTNRDLKEEVKQKRFRPDLYYRLNVFPIHCLALNNRPKDILYLAKMFLTKYDRVEARGHLKFSSAAIAKLASYHWPGNVRELDNLIQRVAVLSQHQRILTSDIVFEGQTVQNTQLTDLNENSFDHEVSNAAGDEVGSAGNTANTSNNHSIDTNADINANEYVNQLGNDVRHHEYQLIIESLEKCQGKKKNVAEQLGISDRTLRYKIAKMREAGYNIPTKKSFA